MSPSVEYIVLAPIGEMKYKFTLLTVLYFKFIVFLQII